MRRLLVMSMILSALFLVSCSSDEPSVTEQVSDKIDQFNTENADKAVKEIKTPINKARLTQQLGDERNRAIDEAMQNQ